MPWNEPANIDISEHTGFRGLWNPVFSRKVGSLGSPVRMAAVSFAMSVVAFAVVASPSSPSSRVSAVDSTRLVTIHFRWDDSQIDASYLDNPRSMQAIHDLLFDTLVVSNLTSVAIMGTASPEGNPAYNNRLAYQRGLTVRDYMASRLPAGCHLTIQAPTVAPYWESMIGLVEADRSVPSREELLQIIRDPKTDDHAKSRKMVTMNGGDTYRHLKESILPYLRTASVRLSFTYRVALPETRETEGHAAAGDSLQAPVQSVQPDAESGLSPLPSPAPASVPTTTGPDTVSMPAPAAVPVADRSSHPAKYLLALRTNLLLDLAGAPNIGIEVPIGKHFSVAAEIAYAFWRIDNRYALQTKQIGAESKYWFGQRGKPLTGWNAGLYAIYCSRFDVQWGNGYQGDGYWSVGLVGGYSLTLGKRIILDFSLGAGYWYSPEVRHYTWPREGHLIWDETRYNVARFSLTRARVNLVWLIGHKKPGGQR